MFLLIGMGAAITALAHMWPSPFGRRLDGARSRSVGDAADGYTDVYLTFDDGLNPSTTPDLLDVLPPKALTRPSSSSTTI
jgi:hypothetical protein